ncbi:alpha-1,2-fucosyltransferase [Maribacter sp. 2307ULW6-5]|uniref:alpha-1,2-fucosyltransferase n=1 Tax=Maribacter sp. 2307ULW6-5 TaxID=3386275 RepID=UPI0039BD0284
MKIVQAAGQTCNQFWIYSHYFAEAMVSKERILILAPDISLKDYPNLRKQSFLGFPFYNESFLKVISYKRYINVLNVLFANKVSVLCLTWLFKPIPKISFTAGAMQAFTSKNRTSHKPALKSIFKPKNAIIRSVDSFMAEKRFLFDVIVGVHIRRGDYKTWQYGKFYYSDEQYLRIMDKMEALFTNKKVGFLICSNEFLDLKRFGAHRAFSLTNGSAAHDLYGLGVCDYILGPPSSFSAWASFYGNVPFYFIEDTSKALSLSLFSKEEYNWPPYKPIKLEN